MTFRDRLLAAGVAGLWGGNFLAIHIGLQHFPPLFMAALRFAVIAVPALLLVPRPRVPLRWLLGYGLGFGTVQFVFLFVAMDIGMPTGLASLVLQASAPFTVLLGAMLLREPISRRQGVGIGLAVLGLATIAVARAQSAALLPVLLTLLGALGWAFGNLAGRLAGREARSGRQPVAPDAVDVGRPTGAAAGDVLAGRRAGRRVGRAAGRGHPGRAARRARARLRGAVGHRVRLRRSGRRCCAATRPAWSRRIRCWFRWSAWRWPPSRWGSGRARSSCCPRR